MNDIKDLIRIIKDGSEEDREELAKVLLWLPIIINLPEIDDIDKAVNSVMYEQKRRDDL